MGVTQYVARVRLRQVRLVFLCACALSVGLCITNLAIYNRFVKVYHTWCLNRYSSVLV